ncbi:hypothetical protein AOLI_G00170370 [Acnodon oligacanthus]
MASEEGVRTGQEEGGWSERGHVITELGRPPDSCLAQASVAIGNRCHSVPWSEGKLPHLRLQLHLNRNWANMKDEPK